MNSENICFKYKSGKVISNSFKKNFKEDIINKIEFKKSQKVINRNKISIENFVPRLKPKKSNIIPSPFELNQKSKKAKFCNNINLKLFNENLSEKDNSSFIDYDSEFDSSSSNEEDLFIKTNINDDLKGSISTNDKSPNKDKDINEEGDLEECKLSENKYINNINNENYKVNLEEKNFIKNLRIQMCNIKNNLINVYNEEKSSKNNIKIKNKYYIKFLDKKDNYEINNEIENSENMILRNENNNNNSNFTKKLSILDTLIKMRTN